MLKKRWLFLLHRWLGIALCLFMAMWFISGVVMMYVGYPKLTQAERVQASPPLSEHCCQPGWTIENSRTILNISNTLRLIQLGDAYQIIATTSDSKKIRAFNANSGMEKTEILPLDIEKVVSQFSPQSRLLTIEKIDEDAWTHSKALDIHRPLFRATLEDTQLAAVYVSSQTGEIVRDLSNQESMWNWVGAWIHWLYPLRGGFFDAWWKDAVIYLSLLAGLGSLLGLIIGVIRWRKARYTNTQSHSPYRSPLLRWHHVVGLISGIFIVLWIVSGLLSMNPWQVFTASGRSVRPTTESLAYVTAKLPLNQALHCFSQEQFDTREIEFSTFMGQLRVIGINARNEARLLADSQTCEFRTAYPEKTLKTYATTLVPKGNLVETSKITEYDWHYYQRKPHTMSGHIEKPLPVIKYVFDDSEHTWIYLDPTTGKVVLRLNTASRVKRILFAFFHSWDWLPLLENRPLWDIAMILGSIAGCIVSISAAMLAWRRLRRPF